MPTIRGENKIAILLTSLPRPAAESVLARLGPDRESRLRQLMDQVRTEFSPELVDDVLGELEDALLQASRNLPARPRLAADTLPDEDEYVPSTPPAGPRLLESDKPSATTTREGVSPAPGSLEDAIAELRSLDGDQLALALEGEHPRGVATVLSCLDPTRACAALMRLPPDLRKDVFSRLGQTTGGAGDVSLRIIRAIVAKCRAATETADKSDGGDKARMMADILKSMERAERLELMHALAERDDALAASVRESLYVFDDLAQMQGQAMQKLLAEIEPKTLAAALQNAPEDIVKNVMANLSKRARESLTEEMSFLDSISTAQIQQSRKVIVDVIQRMDQTG